MHTASARYPDVTVLKHNQKRRRILFRRPLGLFYSEREEDSLVPTYVHNV